MKYFLIILVLLNFSFRCLAQDVPQVKVEPVTECIVYFGADIEKAEKSGEERFEVGRFLPTPGGEGTLTTKRFLVGKSNLYIFASVFYEDDLIYDEQFHDAMTLRISITNSVSENPKSWIGGAVMQVEDREDFGAANIVAFVNRRGKQLFIRMTCQKKNP